MIGIPPPSSNPLRAPAILIYKKKWGPLTPFPLLCYTHRMFLLVLVDNIYPPRVYFAIRGKVNPEFCFAKLATRFNAAILGREAHN
jgi:hypothetical protein